MALSSVETADRATELMLIRMRRRSGRETKNRIQPSYTKLENWKRTHPNSFEPTKPSLLQYYMQLVYRAIYCTHKMGPNLNETMLLDLSDLAHILIECHSNEKCCNASLGT